jgi:hypothetical protein
MPDTAASMACSGAFLPSSALALAEAHESKLMDLQKKRLATAFPYPQI